jgi:hypothetical protein
MTQLIEFYNGTSTDNCGRTINDIHNFNHEQLENTHDYIQWLFPLLEQSAYNKDAPILTDKDVLEFVNNNNIKGNLLVSFYIILGFYGFEINKDLVIKKSYTFNERSKVWLTPFNHNFLRITRILNSLTILGAGPQAISFFECLLEVYKDYKDIISKNTIQFWAAAIGRVFISKI